MNEHNDSLVRFDGGPVAGILSNTAAPNVVRGIRLVAFRG
jgi:hypothetical protein